MLNLEKSRFNPVPGVMDFWNEFRKPNPYRLPILAISSIPFIVIFMWLSGETVYKAPEKPDITYISTLDESRTDEEIMAENEANQEVKDLREAEEQRIAQRKRDLYKALGSATGMDVESIDERGRAERAKAEAEEQRRLDELMGRTESEDSGEGGAP